VPAEEVLRLCRDIYWRYHLPEDGETVVDIGAGYGHEAVFLAAQGRRVRYIAVEVQPSVYECLANTLAPYRPAFTAFPMAVSSSDWLYLHTIASYEDAESRNDAGPVAVPATNWMRFLEHFRLTGIDLLKVNIEGGERSLLEEIHDLSPIKRVLVSAHDFRADRGEGEHFRTRDFVIQRLKDHGFSVRTMGDAPWWRDWIFASKDAFAREQLASM
jgi:FkbM family methyltransferase